MGQYQAGLLRRRWIAALLCKAGQGNCHMSHTTTDTKYQVNAVMIWTEAAWVVHAWCPLPRMHCAPTFADTRSLIRHYPVSLPSTLRSPHRLAACAQSSADAIAVHLCCLACLVKTQAHAQTRSPHLCPAARGDWTVRASWWAASAHPTAPLSMVATGAHHMLLRHMTLRSGHELTGAQTVCHA